MGRNKILSLAGAALLIIGLFLPHYGEKSLIDCMSVETLAIVTGILVLLYAVLAFINNHLGARIMALLTLLIFSWCLFGKDAFSMDAIGIGSWLMLAGAAVGTLFSKADA